MTILCTGFFFVIINVWFIYLPCNYKLKTSCFIYLHWSLFYHPAPLQSYLNIWLKFNNISVDLSNFYINVINKSPIRFTSNVTQCHLMNANRSTVPVHRNQNRWTWNVGRKRRYSVMWVYVVYVSLVYTTRRFVLSVV